MRRAAVLIAMLALAASLSAIEGSAALGADRKSAVSSLTDFNGDGFADLAVGVPFNNTSGVEDAGAAHVLYGSAGGLQATAPDDQFWSQDSPDVDGAAEKGDRFGYSVAAGDFNGDGFADLAVGVPLEDIGAVVDAGAVSVLYGSATGLQAIAPEDQLWSQDSPDVDGAPEANDQFGYSLAAGDFNNDTFSDLAVGVPFEDIGSVIDAGAMHVLHGSPAGLQAIAPEDQLWSQDSADVQDSAEQTDRYSFAVAAGDFNNDAFADLATGVPLEDQEGPTTRREVGGVHVLYGSLAGLQATGPDDQFWMQGRDGVQDRAEIQDRLGWSASTGDFNGDGFDDLIAGIPLENVRTVSNAGAAIVLYGSAAGLQATAPDDQFWHQDVPGVIGLAESLDQFGFSVAAGDFDGDGFDDLAVGVNQEDGGEESFPQSGAANILYGSASGIQAARDWHLEQGDDPVEDASDPWDRFGSAMAIGDFNADGHADLAVGVPFEEITGSPYDMGAVHVLYSTAAGLQAADPDDQLWTQDSPDVKDRGGPGDRFGTSLAGPTTAF